MRENYEVVIGLEVHAELKTNTKVFCACENKFGSEPNTNCCPVCIGLPGALPVLNKRAVELTIKAGLCMGCDINDIAVFERKNYFYPDLSKAYQISQLERPICLNGGLYVNDGTKFIRLNRIHLEEDAGKLVHKNETVGTLIDYNRGGVPLIEMVTEPDISSADEAVQFLTQLRSNLIYADIADCKMEQGGMRCDVNLSIRKKGETKLGTRTEMKNLNSFKSVQRAIEYEIDRQIEVLENGGVIKQETRKWDDERGVGFALRSKESSQDYRYFPDPDLLSVSISRQLVSQIKEDIPLLPEQRKNKYINEFNLPKYDADILTSEKVISDYFDNCVALYNQPKKISNWIMTELLKLANKEEDETIIPLDYQRFVEVIKLYDDKLLGQNNAKQLLELLINESGSAKEVATKHNMINDVSQDDLENIVKKIIEDNPKAKADYAVDSQKVLPFFFGQVMKATKGKANADVVKKLLDIYLK